jgi:hypothetical protein
MGIVLPYRQPSEVEVTYKSTFSIVLFAFVDANYSFLFVNIVCKGRISNGDVFRNWQLNAKTGFLPLAALTGRNKPFPYLFVVTREYNQSFLRGVLIFTCKMLVSYLLDWKKCNSSL